MEHGIGRGTGHVITRGDFSNASSTDGTGMNSTHKSSLWRKKVNKRLYLAAKEVKEKAAERPKKAPKKVNEGAKEAVFLVV